MNNADCLDHYVVKVTSISSFSITVTDTTYLLDANNSKIDRCLLHTVSVAGVDGANRTGERSQEVEFILTGEHFFNTILHS